MCKIIPSTCTFTYRWYMIHGHSCCIRQSAGPLSQISQRTCFLTTRVKNNSLPSTLQQRRTCFSPPVTSAAASPIQNYTSVIRPSRPSQTKNLAPTPYWSPASRMCSGNARRCTPCILGPGISVSVTGATGYSPCHALPN